ncbi:helix-turn-helix domain-containing protein [Paenibacillus puerhi]|uniref:helix-turn-helix domain-containing protein n=1 Tax=Paenibacillus puerhi TaxID=2692622 RepID=UPI00135B2A02|nr:helix-turn-helix domain-containing protein [Paenibacillus puerhi]
MLNKLRSFFTSESGWARKKVLIVASLLATIPVLVMGMSAYYMISGAFKEEIRLANRQTMLQIQQRIDEKLVMLEKVTLQNAVNPVLAQFLSLENPEDDFETFGKTMSLLNSMQVLIQDVDNVYLYRPDKRLVISPNAGMKGEEMLPAHIREAVSLNPSGVWIDHALDSSLVREGFHRITYVRRIHASNSSSDGYLLLNLNDTAFFRVFSNMQLGSRELLIVTPSGNIFSNGGSALLPNQLRQYEFIDQLMKSDINEMLLQEQVAGRSMFITSLRSSYNGWKYVTIIPYSDLTRYLDGIKQTTFLICFLLVVISAVSAGLFSKGWYRPLQSLVDLIKNKSGPVEFHRNQSEFAVIRNYFESLQKSNELLDKQIKESMPLLRVNFIQNLLSEPFHSSMTDRAKYYDIPLKHAYYTVICVELDNMRGHTEQDINLFYYAVANISREVTSHHAEGIVIRMYSGHIAILINHAAEEDSLLVDLKSVSFRVAEEIRNVSENLLHITVTMGIGRSYEGLAQVRASYCQALEALEYQLIAGSGRVLFIEQIKPGAASFSYPYEIEQQIVTHLKMANLASIHSFIDEFNQALKTEVANSEYVRQSFAQLIAVSLRSLFELDSNFPQLHEYNLYQHLNELNTSEKIVHWLKTEVYPPIVEHIHNRMVHRNHGTIQMTLDHIHRYYDTDLSLTLFADMVSMPVSQFSYMFKEEMGINFSEYLISHRMEKARELLEQTDTRISDIAEKLRYNNSQNFIRIFKKMNGMTPGEYRSRYSRPDKG